MAQSAAVRPEAEVQHKRAMRPIDLVHLAKQCLGDHQLEHEILRMYDATVDSYMRRLKAATNTSDMALTLHSIRGASAGVGAFTIAELANVAECDLRAGQVVNPETLADLGLAVEEVRSFIGRVLSADPV